MHTVGKKAKWQLSTDSWLKKMWSRFFHKTVLEKKDELQSQKMKPKRQRVFRTQEEQQGQACTLELAAVQTDPKDKKMGPGM